MFITVCYYSYDFDDRDTHSIDSLPHLTQILQKEEYDVIKEYDYEPIRHILESLSLKNEKK